jgi:hypothetical protein
LAFHRHVVALHFSPHALVIEVFKLAQCIATTRNQHTNNYLIQEFQSTVSQASSSSQTRLTTMATSPSHSNLPLRTKLS